MTNKERTLIEYYEKQRTEIERNLIDILKQETRRWYEDRGYDDYANGDSCSRQFFDDTRSARVHSYIEHTRDKHGHKTRGTHKILREIRRFYGVLSDKSSTYTKCKHQI